MDIGFNQGPIEMAQPQVGPSRRMVGGREGSSRPQKRQQQAGMTLICLLHQEIDPRQG